MKIATRRHYPFLRTAIALAQLALVGAAHAQNKPKPPALSTPSAPAQSSPAVPAQPPPSGEQQSPGWTVQCVNPGTGLECKALLTLAVAKTRQLLLSVSVSKPAEGKDGAMLIQLPHGLFNPAGVMLAVDDQKAETLQIQTCDAKGCYAGAPIPPEKLTTMAKGNKLNITVQDLKKQPITVPVPLKGFEEAYKKL